MDFFDRQDRARHQTRRLLVMFALSVVVIILSIYLVIAVAVSQTHAARTILRPDETDLRPMAVPHDSLWNPQLFAMVSLGTILVISVASLYKISELSAGGETVALMLGGRPIAPQTQDLAERRLLNVVEEMALASGVPVPPVYVLDHEPSINAFAAGHSPADAVVAVSAGCLQYLNREELQGVMGHEFSHILNGDMRLNLRLIGIVYGILALAVIGYYVMRSAGYVSSGNSRRDNSGVPLLLVGLILIVFGYLGVLLGKLIRAAINRQREFLADASSVQFTRNPGGITGALKKIGGLSAGSRIRDAHAEEVSHMFFGDAFAGSFFNLFATHPPLDVRIRRFEPTFDGRFPRVAPLTTAGAEPSRPLRQPSATARAVPLAGAIMGLSTPGVPSPVADRVGTPQPEHLDHALQTREAMPPMLLDAAREPFGARAVVYALLLSRDDEATLPEQWQHLAQQCDRATYQQTEQLRPLVEQLAVAARLPLVDLTVPALKKCSPQQYMQFRETVELLVRGHGKGDLFEYCLRMVLFSYLDVHFGLKKPPVARYRATTAIVQPASVMLSVLAYVGQKEPEAVQRAFQAGTEGRLAGAVLGPPATCTLRAFDAALAELAQSSPGVKRNVLEAAAACIAADGKVTLEENELLRSVAAVLGCPLPPVLVG